jgi:hypothetical protein
MLDVIQPNLDLGSISLKGYKYILQKQGYEKYVELLKHPNQNIQEKYLIS